MMLQILLLRHYPLSEGPSMRSFADQIVTGLRSRGHIVHQATAPVLMARLARRGHPVLAKWLAYVDQFVLFPPLLWWRVRRLPAGSLCVVADQALGPWIPWLKPRSHVVHVHDLLALEAAENQQPFHRLPWSGRLYQRWIRRDFRQARCFLSVSQATRHALLRQLKQKPLLNEVVLNPLQTRFRPLPAQEVEASLDLVLPDLNGHPFLFHIGRSWYKNRLGLLAIWNQLPSLENPVHLVLLGDLDPAMRQWLLQHSKLCSRLHVLAHASDAVVLALYNRAAALLFPSHAEGFGWPILEAMACGCPVITTDQPPMTEVGGDIATYIPPCPIPLEARQQWAWQAAQQVLTVLRCSTAEQEERRLRGITWAARFDQKRWLDQLEAHYKQALVLQEHSACAD